jgi:hypothetical protein
MADFDIARREQSADYADTMPMTDGHMHALLSTFHEAPGGDDHDRFAGGTETPLTANAMINALAQAV